MTGKPCQARSQAFIVGLPTLALMISLLVSPFFRALPATAEQSCQRLVIIGDPHLPGQHLDLKRKIIADINGWNDVDLAVVVGDLCETVGTENEYSFAKAYFAELKKPQALINGNHDYAFSRKAFNDEGVFRLASSTERSDKLSRFMTTFGQADLYRSRDLGPYHLIFLSLDSLDSKTYAQLSEKQIKWLGWDLYENRTKPTIIFCHAPLWKKAVTDTNPRLVHFTAQPQDVLIDLLKQHPQAFLWVAGHVHLGALNPVANSPLNRLEHLTVINDCDLNGRSIIKGMDPILQDHGTLWTTSMWLYPEKVLVKVYDHTAGKWVEELNREFPRPAR